MKVTDEKVTAIETGLLYTTGIEKLIQTKVELHNRIYIYGASQVLVS
jgi:hypothetical protein